MTIRYAVTFEFELRPPLTHRGTVEGAGAATCVRRAVSEAQRVLRPRQWTSLVCALLERVPEAATGIVAPERETAAAPAGTSDADAAELVEPG